MSYQIIVLLQLSSKLFCLNLSWLLTSVHLSGNPTSHHCILALLEIVDSTGCWYTGYKAKLISLPVHQETFCTKPMGLLFILLTVNHRKPLQMQLLSKSGITVQRSAKNCDCGRSVKHICHWFKLLCLVNPISNLLS